MMKEIQIDYVGDELELFKHATNWKAYFSRRLHPYITGSVLEVGGGIGANTPYLAQGSTKWHLLEPDIELVKQIETEKLTRTGLKVEVIHGTVSSIPERRFDTIIYIDVIEHIEDSMQEIRLAKKLLNPGGKLILLAPAYQYLYSEFDQRIGHFRRYNKDRMLSEINDELELIRIHYLDSIGVFASLINKWFLHKSLPSPSDIQLWDKRMIPLSKITDPIFGYSFGKSLIGVFRKRA